MSRVDCRVVSKHKKLFCVILKTRSQINIIVDYSIGAKRVWFSLCRIVIMIRLAANLDELWFAALVVGF